MNLPTEQPDPTAQTTAGDDPVGLVSIHDLMPATLPAVRRTIRLLEGLGSTPVTLLVVPGTGWSRDGIRYLRSLQDNGYRLAGHGWQHRVDAFGGLYHRLHGLLLSRRVAEHLALDEDAIIALMARCHAWFGDNGLTPPSLYVPPAWAMGRVSLARLAQDSPFRLYETFSGLQDAESGRLLRLPLLGYEADSALRVPVIRAWNALNRYLARRCGRLRIGLHPFDHELHLRADLIADLQRYRSLVDYDTLRATLPAPALGSCPGPETGGR
ncbi:DUF2334 domain-containing protein [Thiohalocapsa marina]|uniref:DUF2334 domain-containing protein n=1 Tax=Thiohalocapsa marina TaxID=424902 RepID=A0A5M8FMR2_9GAMM|nr:polysaccharide deacetylase family protein [Thiohalocapsa marina]KAA6185784.1 DUF2334 domain-containing protein [Thiohalocapsa marina]